MDGTRAGTGARWLVGALASVPVLLFALTAAGPAHATSEATVTLWLDRSDGPPGTKVVATAWGLADCHASAATSPSPGARAKAGGGVVKIFWEGLEQPVGSAVVPTSGVVEVPFSVPAEATGQRYAVTSVCMTNAKLADDDSFVVTRSEAAVVVPPTVTPETVRPPSVSPSAVAPSQTATPETVAPKVVSVPRVVGLKVADADAKLSALGLVLRVTSGAGDVVVSQSPTAGARVGVGHAVRITVELAVVPPQPVPVPNPVGEPPVVAPSAFPWSRAGLLSLVVLVAGAVTYRVARVRLDRRWVRNKLRVVVPPAPPIDAQLTESEPVPPMPVVRLEPHADAGAHILEGD
ncbi:MAG TPA: PASTA domain-containing protein [Kribbella sp.]|nr:PASTA domain-containing protein [Kribbella sp.]